MHPFIIGVLIGGVGFGGSFGIIGWCLGYGHAMQKVESWMRPKVEQPHGEVPNLPPLRERRQFPTTPGRWA